MTTHTPDIMIPELPRELAALARPLRELLSRRVGIMGAWLPAQALHDDWVRAQLSSQGSELELIVPTLCEAGCEFSEALTQGRVHLLLAGMSQEACEAALEVDTELADAIGRGYRLVRFGRECFEIEALARQVLGLEANLHDALWDD